MTLGAEFFSCEMTQKICDINTNKLQNSSMKNFEDKVYEMNFLSVFRVSKFFKKFQERLEKRIE